MVRSGSVLIATVIGGTGVFCRAGRGRGRADVFQRGGGECHAGLALYLGLFFIVIAWSLHRMGSLASRSGIWRG